MSLPIPIPQAQGTGIYLEEETEIFQEPDVVDGFKESIFQMQQD